MRTAVWALTAGTSPPLPTGKVLAFHGTHMENVHSILHLGLLNLSGTRLQRTGGVGAGATGVIAGAAWGMVGRSALLSVH